MVNSLLVGALLLPLAVAMYAYLLYPVLLRLGGAFRCRVERPKAPADWPRISMTVPAYNEEASIRGAIEGLLSLDYPADRRQILIVSDASSDATDDIVHAYASRGVELVCMPRRVGKTAAEDAARSRLTGDIVVNTDASVCIQPEALKALVAWFEDPEVGVASGRDISVAWNHGEANAGESGYVGYEMWIRRLETRLRGIVGASGCLYAIRRELHDTPLPDWLSRDFAAALIARERGFRAVSVDDAICYVPRSPSLRHEYKRKVRTITRGLETLFYKRRLLNPLRYGPFAWMLWSHKLCRWLLPLTALPAAAALVGLAPRETWASWLLSGVLLTALLGALGWKFQARRPVPPALSFLTYVLAANLAVLRSWWLLLSRERSPIWEPTRRARVEAP